MSKGMTDDTCTSGCPAEDGVRSATPFALRVRLFADKITLCCLLAMAGAGACSAGEFDVSVVDRQGRGVSDVVVTAAPLGKHLGAPPPASAVMDQRDVAFVPAVLVVAVGTSVDFPNNDSVSHQVYSFSPAKRFQLPLYKGEPHTPVIFEHAGLVVLGCNIHDAMAGYVYVTDAPFFGKTGADGVLRLRDIPQGDYRITVWSPFISDAAPTLDRTIHVNGQEVSADRVQLTGALRTRPEPRPRRGDWEY